MSPFDSAFLLRSLVLMVGLASSGCMGMIAAEPATPETLGPRPVGVTTMRVEDDDRDRNLTVEVWYPAAERSSAEPTVYCVEAIGTTVARIKSAAGAHRDAAPSREEGPRPVVLLSHGAGSTRYGNATLAEVLASHGYVVAAPDHVGHTMSSHVFGIDNDERAQSAFDRPLDLSRVLDALEQRSRGNKFVLKGLVDASRVAVAGHSFGGAAALGLIGARFDSDRQAKECAKDDADRRCAAVPVFGPGQYRYRDPRIAAALLITPAGFDLYRADGIAQVDAPALVVGAERDTTTPFLEYSKPIYESLKAPHYLLDLEQAGHLTATDVCEIVESVGFPAKIGGDPRAEDGCGSRYLSSKAALDRVASATLPFLDLHLNHHEAARRELTLALAPPQGAPVRVAAAKPERPLGLPFEGLTAPSESTQARAKSGIEIGRPPAPAALP